MSNKVSVDPLASVLVPAVEKDTSPDPVTVPPPPVVTELSLKEEKKKVIVAPPPSVSKVPRFEVQKTKQIPWKTGFIILTEGDVISDELHGTGSIVRMQSMGVQLEEIK